MTEPSAHVPSDSPPADAACCGGGSSLIDPAAAAELADRLGALADPVRLQMLSILATSATGEVCACDFVGPIGKSQPTISHHLKVLTAARLVTGEKRGRWVWYRLAPGAVDELLHQFAGAVPSAATTTVH